MFPCWLGLLLIRITEKETGRTKRLRDELEQMPHIKVRTADGTFEVVTEPTSN